MFDRFRRHVDSHETRQSSGTRSNSSGGLLQAVLDAMPVGVVLNNAKAQPSMSNALAREMSGDYQRAALLNSAIARGAERAACGTEYRESVDFSGVDAPSYVVSAAPLPDGGSVAVVEDVSERRQVEAIRRDFVTNVGHELRTPIGAIVLLAESLAGERDPQAAEEMTRHIANEANRAAYLIDELLSLSKVQSAKNFALESLSVQSLVRDVLAEVTPSAIGANVELNVHRPEDDFTVQGIREDLVSAIGNLLLNAFKYSGESDAVDFRISATPEGLCLFNVRDQGIGIPAQDHERIFERFYRVDRARARATGGSGLGLAIVRHVAANHGGWVSVESREGEGSSFTLAIPMNVAGK